MQSFTSSYDGLSLKLINSVGVVPAFQPDSANSESAPSPLLYPAQWDTGATATCISQRIIGILGLIPFSKTQIATPSGVSEKYCYMCNITLPNNLTVTNTIVIGSEIGISGIDALIGMDIIGKGDFIVSNYNGKTIFTFRYPSCHSYDFTKNQYLFPAQKEATPPRNGLCPCGSGKKYKHCHGKNS